MGTNPLGSADWGVLGAELVPEFDGLTGDTAPFVAILESFAGAAASSATMTKSLGFAVDAALEQLGRAGGLAELSLAPRWQALGPIVDQNLSLFSKTIKFSDSPSAENDFSGVSDRLTGWGDATHLRACACRQCQSAADSFSPVESTAQFSSESGIEALLSGYRLDAGTNITFSFVNSFTAPTYNGSNNERVSELSDPIKTSVRTILKSYIEPLINLTFTEVAESPGNFGQMRLMFSDLGGGGGYAYAYYPDATSVFSIGSDVHLSDRYLDPALDPYNNFASGPGSHGYTTLIHELGHALGLKHPGNYNAGGGGAAGPYLPTNLDNLGNTVMSYNFDGFAPSTLMPLDIAALQSMYGSKAFNADNTVYRFTQAHEYSISGSTVGGAAAQRLTLADSGGVDQLVFSEMPFSESGYRMDLRPGGSISTRSDFDSMTGLASRGTWLSLDTTIENVINSSSDDLIIANGAVNVFGGYDLFAPTGNDVIVGANSRDLLNLRAFSPANVAQRQRDNDLLLDLGAERSITLSDYYATSSGDRLRVQFAEAPASILAADDFSPGGSTSGSNGLEPFDESDLFTPAPIVSAGLPELAAASLG